MLCRQRTELGVLTTPPGWELLWATSGETAVSENIPAEHLRPHILLVKIMLFSPFYSATLKFT